MVYKQGEYGVSSKEFLLDVVVKETSLVLGEVEVLTSVGNARQGKDKVWRMLPGEEITISQIMKLFFRK